MRSPSSYRPTERRALWFVIVVGIMSFFADTTYEGARGVNGQFLQRPAVSVGLQLLAVPVVWLVTRGSGAARMAKWAHRG